MSIGAEGGAPRPRRPGALSGWAGAGALGAVTVVVLLLAVFGPDGSLPLDNGPMPTIVSELAVLGVAIGVLGRPKRWWMTWGLGIAVTAAAVVASARWWLLDSGLVNQHYPPSFLLWVWGALVAVGVAVTGWWSGPAAVRMLRVVTVPVALFGSFLLINAHYGYWPTMGALLDRPAAGQVSGRALARVLTGHSSSRVGQFGPVSIPGPAGFKPGPTWVWVPPDFHRAGAADMPVLVMLPGIPGRSYDWEQAGEVVSLANSWARKHGGVAPVMILTTENGAGGHDTECVNGPQGNAETYLTHSIPDYITQHLGITADPARWGVVGFSEGGTCAIGLAVEHPQLYGRFVDIAGDLAPNFGPDNRSTLTYLYDGNTVAMLHHEPLWQLSHHTYPGLEGWFAGSSADRIHELIARQLTAAAQAAGMKASDVGGGPGGHSWSYAGKVFRSVYPALVDSMPAPAWHPVVHHHQPVLADRSRSRSDPRHLT
jgi:enterochelin esterase-like enzyme